LYQIIHLSVKENLLLIMRESCLNGKKTGAYAELIGIDPDIIQVLLLFPP
jgi:hypothetical protein